MDNNQTNQPVQPAAPVTPQPAPEAPIQPTVPQVPMAESSGDSKKMILWLVIGVIVIIAIVGGIYLFLSRQQAVPVQEANTIQAPIAAPEENLEAELQSLDVEAGADAEFAAIDQDLNQL
ncbi:MAG: hypothetical protein NUV73_00725 [Candidatus Daviesbacteria bacterium]|nr:hypothetical protein [Candidatus Daviesbacteria bacterium]